MGTTVSENMVNCDASWACSMLSGNQLKKLPLNYSIKNIIASLLQDIPHADRFSTRRKKELYQNARQVINNNKQLKSILSLKHIHNYPIPESSFFARLGVLPAQLVIVDERFQNLCGMPYWTVYNNGRGGTYKRFDKCPGYGRLPGCPPLGMSIGDVYESLRRSTHIIVLQTRLLNERWNVKWKFDVLHRLARDIEDACGIGVVTGRFGSGPCNACSAQYCLKNQECKSPDLKTVSLEGAGICVDRLCSDLALVTGNRAWKLIWLKHFGLPQQRPKQWKYVEAITVNIS